MFKKKMPFYVGIKRYYEITLQLANKYATKFNRITVYSKQNISTGYSINIGYTDTTIDLWGIASNIKNHHKLEGIHCTYLFKQTWKNIKYSIKFECKLWRVC